MFAAYAVLWSWARPGTATRRGWTIRIAVVGLILAIGTEWVQGFPWVRQDPDRLDALADTVGLVTGLALAGKPWRSDG